jgi:hypothetical protein
MDEALDIQMAGASDAETPALSGLHVVAPYLEKKLP